MEFLQATVICPWLCSRQKCKLRLNRESNRHSSHLLYNNSMARSLMLQTWSRNKETKPVICFGSIKVGLKAYWGTNTGNLSPEEVAKLSAQGSTHSPTAQEIGKCGERRASDENYLSFFLSHSTRTSYS